MRFRTKAIAICLVPLAFGFGVYAGMAGAPEPPGPPASTSSYTLDDIYSRLDEGTEGVPGTFTEPSSGPGTGTMHTLDDIMAIAPAVDQTNGATVADVAVGKTYWGLTASGWGQMTGTAAKADGPCWDNTNRYVDCGNGTVHDTVTRLIWLKKATCYATLFTSYADASERAAGLKDGECGLTDNSTPGDWRLPTADEWAATTDRARAMGCQNPALTNTAGTGCFADGPEPFTGVPSGSFAYWTSSALADFPDAAGYLQLGTGLPWIGPKASYHHIWPVRGGQ
jgi:hypothetical protein